MSAQVMLVNMYGWTGANTRDDSAEKTDDLCCIVLAEIESWNSPLVIWTGDMNGDLERFPILADAVDRGMLVDLGAVADA